MSDKQLSLMLDISYVRGPGSNNVPGSVKHVRYWKQFFANIGANIFLIR